MAWSITPSSKLPVILLLLILFVEGLATPAPSPAAIGFVKECHGNNGSGTATTCTFGSNVSAGNLVACVPYGKGTTTATVTLADTVSNTYTANTAYVTDSTTTGRGIAYYAKNVTGGFTTITATWSATVSYSGLSCHEISGADTTAPADGSTGQSQLSVSAGTNVVQSGNITTASNGDYLFGVTFDFAVNCPTYTAGTGYTGVTLTGCYPANEYQIQATAGTIQATFSPGCCTGNYMTFIQAFKAAAGGSSRRSSMMLMGVQ